MEKVDPERALFAASLRVDMSLLCLLAKADVLGRICQDQSELLSRIEIFELFCREQGCWMQPKAFASAAGRFHYFHHQRGTTDYEPLRSKEAKWLCCVACREWEKITLLLSIIRNGKWSALMKFVARIKSILPIKCARLGRSTSEGAGESLVTCKKDFIWNATSLSASLRASMIGLFARYQAKIHLIYLEVPYKQWQQQNRQRDYAVPEKVMERMASKLELPTPDEAHQVSYVIQGEFQSH